MNFHQQTLALTVAIVVVLSTMAASHAQPSDSRRPPLDLRGLR